MNVVIRNERNDELKIIENATREAFWNVYKPGCDEHLMVHQLHDSKKFLKELAFVAESDGHIVGNIICSKAIIRNDKEQHEIVAIGPIGVIPEYQKKGIGSLLMKQAIDRARDMGFAGIVLYGDPKYYHRFGFVSADNYAVTTGEGTNFDAFMILELDHGKMKGITGRCFEDQAFEIKEADLAEFEKGFCEKEKK